MKFADFSEFFAKLTFTEGALLILLLLGGLWLYRSHARELRDRQSELDRLAADNHDYRDRFERMHDKIELLTERLANRSVRPSSKARAKKRP